MVLFWTFFSAVAFSVAKTWHLAEKEEEQVFVEFRGFSNFSSVFITLSIICMMYHDFCKQIWFSSFARVASNLIVSLISHNLHIFLVIVRSFLIIFYLVSEVSVILYDFPSSFV